ncbi:hypothetical protein L3X38_010205 [Prunus dulcis]|uniref:Reverse transcriptase domain-containing protein n=1 Tax=Prunus dulcis TaxID=3755 RepID=A0AAD4WF48_PRUDU|nr:hypothetical protein L3X38_010205 [Prunus dulcis]
MGANRGKGENGHAVYPIGKPLARLDFIECWAGLFPRPWVGVILLFSDWLACFRQAAGSSLPVAFFNKRIGGAQITNKKKLPTSQAVQKKDVYGDRTEVERLVKAGFIRPSIYADWLSNIVPVLKRKTGAVKICVDYRNLNEASPKVEYPMPMADMLVDEVAQNQMLSFMDGNAGYNHIMVAEENIHKTAFMCPGHIGAFEYTVMPFGLRNAGDTYQRAMNSVFHDMIGHSLEVYIDDMVIKSPEKGDHVSNLKKAFLRMRQYKLKMNPKKCVFGVQAGNFLGFLVHQRGIEIDKNKAKSIMEAFPP